MGGQRLHDCICVVDPHRRRAGRQARRKTRLHGGLCAFHRSVACLYAGAQRRDPDRGACGARSWRRHPGAEFAGVAQSRLSRREGSRPCDRHVGGGREPRAHRRPAGRWRADHLGRLAQHLSGQPADRIGRFLADMALRERNAGLPQARARSGRTSRGHRRAWRIGRSADPRRTAWLDECVCARRVLRRDVMCGAILSCRSAALRSRCCRCRSSPTDCSR